MKDDFDVDDNVQPSPLSNSAIREYAERIGNHYDMYDSYGRIDLEGLVGYLGGGIRQGLEDESLQVNGDGSFIIFIPPFTSARRDRFTIAHELGHYFLHYLHAGRSGQQTFMRGMRNRIETQANVFASSLLMPTDSFISAWRENNGEVNALALRFDVSPAAATVRAQVLGLTQ